MIDKCTEVNDVIVWMAMGFVAIVFVTLIWSTVWSFNKYMNYYWKR